MSLIAKYFIPVSFNALGFVACARGAWVPIVDRIMSSTAMLSYPAVIKKCTAISSDRWSNPDSVGEDANALAAPGGSFRIRFAGVIMLVLSSPPMFADALGSARLLRRSFR